MLKWRGGKWRWILYDTDMSFQEGNQANKYNVLENLFSLEENASWSNLLFRKLFENEEFRNEYIQRTAIYLNTIFKPECCLGTQRIPCNE